MSRVQEHRHIESKKPDMVPVANECKIGFCVDNEHDIRDCGSCEKKVEILMLTMVDWLCAKKRSIKIAGLSLFAEVGSKKALFIGLDMGGSDGMKLHFMQQGQRGGNFAMSPILALQLLWRKIGQDHGNANDE